MTSRKIVCQNIFARYFLLVLIYFFSISGFAAETARPNFLFILSDDQSWEHTSYAGYPLIKTPAFDRIAAQGVYFRNAFVSAPTCTASRSAILSGQHFWQTGSGALLWGNYPVNLPNFIHRLSGAGYTTAYTGKGWGPGSVPREENPVGSPANRYTVEATPKDGYIGEKGYGRSFEDFLDSRDQKKPFFFWAGLLEPHRDFLDKKSNRFDTKDAAAAWPKFMPNIVRAQKQMSRYLEEIEYSDAEVSTMLAALEARGLLSNTIIIYTSDNGMSFAGAKANLYRYGVQVPLAIWWSGHQNKIKQDRDELVSLIDIAPTVLQLAGEKPDKDTSGRSLVPLIGEAIAPNQRWPERDFVLTGFERHAPNARTDLSTYPSRSIVTKDWLFIHNYQPYRWPQGDPEKYMDAPAGNLYTIKNKKIEPFFSDLLGKRPEYELYRIDDVPGAATNKAGKVEFIKIQTELSTKLDAALIAGKDPGVKDRDYFFKNYGKIITKAPAKKEKEAGETAL